MTGGAGAGAQPHQISIPNFFIRMPWTYVLCSAKSNEKRLYENEKTFYRNSWKCWWVLLIIKGKLGAVYG
jgi:hypothetical protein